MTDEPTNNVAVRANGLTKTYGEGETEVHALQDVTFEIPRGEFVVLQGASGSGKTTLLNQIGALEPPTSGDVHANGFDLNGLDDNGRTEYRLKSVGFVFQFYNLVPSLTAYENVALVAELTGSDVEERTKDVLESVGLADRIDHFPGQLSGGEQQRVSIARGLVKNPPLMLCDEPTGALDTETGTQVLTLLRDITDNGDRTIIVVTHNSQIAEIANRVIDLRDGEIVGEENIVSPKAPVDVAW
jgi:putative ABC transport system ATP-binding protein